MSGVANHERPFNRAYFFIMIIKTDKIQTTTKKKYLIQSFFLFTFIYLIIKLNIIQSTFLSFYLTNRYKKNKKNYKKNKNEKKKIFF